MEGDEPVFRCQRTVSIGGRMKGERWDRRRPQIEQSR